MKKLGIIIMMIGISISTISCNKEKEIITDALKFKKEYESVNNNNISIPQDNAIVYSNPTEILSILKKTGIIYFGYPECPWCRSAVPTLLNTANMVGIDQIYYYNAKEIRDNKHLDEGGKIITDKEGTQEYKKLIEALKEVLPVYDGLNDESIKRLYFPTVVFVKDGKILGLHVGTVKSQTDPNTLLTKQQEQELSLIYSDYMHQVLGDVCDESC